MNTHAFAGIMSKGWRLGARQDERGRGVLYPGGQKLCGQNGRRRAYHSTFLGRQGLRTECTAVCADIQVS